MRKIKNQVILALQNLWNTTRRKEQLSFFPKVLFFFLCCCEKIYNVIFILDQKIRYLCGQKKNSGIRVISVGNLTTGGTGKSVVVAFLVDLLGAHACAIISRGYGRTVVNNQKNVLICDDGEILVPVAQAGDEAFMLARQCKCPIVVGADRYASCTLLRQKMRPALHTIILDDAYQNHQLKKDYEILLLDAQAPFDNGHCLPAGRLRERDYRRADIIFLTHADQVSVDQIQQIKTELNDFPQTSIFCVKHSIKTFFCAGIEQTSKPFFEHKKLLVVAGIGSFDNFQKNLQDSGITIHTSCEFPDHHNYSGEDIRRLIFALDNDGFDAVITTAKDWVKIEPIIKKDYAEKLRHFFVASVSIEFLLLSEYSHFVRLLREGKELN